MCDRRGVRRMAERCRPRSANPHLRVPLNRQQDSWLAFDRRCRRCLIHSASSASCHSPQKPSKSSARETRCEPSSVWSTLTSGVPRCCRSERLTRFSSASMAFLVQPEIAGALTRWIDTGEKRVREPLELRLAQLLVLDGIDSQQLATLVVQSVERNLSPREAQRSRGSADRGPPDPRGYWRAQRATRGRLRRASPCRRR
jgi:hypothetical protein